MATITDNPVKITQTIEFLPGMQKEITIRLEESDRQIGFSKDPQQLALVYNPETNEIETRVYGKYAMPQIFAVPAIATDDQVSEADITARLRSAAAAFSSNPADPAAIPMTPVIVKLYTRSGNGYGALCFSGTDVVDAYQFVFVGCHVH